LRQATEKIFADGFFGLVDLLFRVNITIDYEIPYMAESINDGNYPLALASFGLCEGFKVISYYTFSKGFKTLCHSMFRLADKGINYSIKGIDFLEKRLFK